MFITSLINVQMAIVSILGVVPDTELQEKIAVICMETEAADGEVLKQKIPELLNSVEGDRIALLQQILLFMNSRFADKDTSQDYIKSAALAMYLRCDADEMLSGVVPLLDGEDAEFNKLLTQVLLDIEKRHRSKNPKVSPLHTYVEIYSSAFNSGEGIPRGLTRTLYARFPSATLEFLMMMSSVTKAEKDELSKYTQLIYKRFAEREQVRLEEDVVPVREALDVLLKSDKWWIRYFAVEVMVQDPVLAPLGKDIINEKENDDTVLMRVLNFNEVSSNLIGNDEKQLSVLQLKQPSTVRFKLALGLYLKELNRDKYDMLISMSEGEKAEKIYHALGLKLASRVRQGNHEMVDDFIDELKLKLNEAAGDSLFPGYCLGGLAQVIGVGVEEVETVEPPYGSEKVYAIFRDNLSHQEMALRWQCIQYMHSMATQFSGFKVRVYQDLVACKKQYAKEASAGTVIHPKVREALDKSILRTRS